MTPAAKLPPCDQLDQVHAFADGELAAPEAARVRVHLASCRFCQAELEDVLQVTNLGALLEPRAGNDTGGKPKPGVAERRLLPHWMRRSGGGRTALRAAVVALAAAAAVIVFVKPPKDEGGLNDEWEQRNLEVRLSYPGADKHKPYDVPRGGGAAPGAIPLERLARLEKKGDQHGLGVGLLLRGEVQQAEKALAAAPPSPAVKSDRAALLLARATTTREQPKPGEGEPIADALTLLGQALEADPKLSAARWNQGLALRELGLTLAAAEAFAEVAALGEPGWSAEAGARASALRAEFDARQRSWETDSALGRAALASHGAIPEDALRRHPGILRIFVYDLLRIAPTPAAARAVLPMARVLDELAGGSVLVQTVERLAARDFGKRAPLAARYRQLVLDQLDAAGKAALISDLLAASEPDLTIGALLRTYAVTEHFALFERLARESQDPWFQAHAEHEAGKRRLQQGDPLGAQQILAKAFSACLAAHLDYRCARIAQDLAQAWSQLDRPAEAWTVANTGLRLARAEGIRALDQSPLIELLGNLGIRQRQSALSRAYLREVLLRRPGECGVERYVHQLLGWTALQDFNGAAARRELRLVPACPGEPAADLDLLYLHADLMHLDPVPGDVAEIRGAVAALRQGGKLTASDRSLADLVEGMALLEQDRAAGQALVRASIAAAEKLPGNEQARKWRGYGFTALLQDAGRAGEWTRALALFAEAERAPLPDRCVLGVSVDDSRRVAAARGAGGEALGAWAADVRGPIAEAGSVVPKAVVDALRACSQVQVFARPPLHGRPLLLPSELAWSYRVGHRQDTQAAAAPSHELVVTGVEAPAGLGLPRLADWTTQAAPGAARTELRGSDATPERVLAALAQTGLAEIHAHGLSDLSASDASLLVLSPGTSGAATLSARQVRAAHLAGAPLVLLAACSAARPGSALDAAWSLPVAFLEAGARAVIASAAEIPDAQARGFFDGLKARIRAGSTPATAVRDERAACRARGGDCAWTDQILVFD